LRGGVEVVSQGGEKKRKWGVAPTKWRVSPNRRAQRGDFTRWALRKSESVRDPFTRHCAPQSPRELDRETDAVPSDQLWSMFGQNDKQGQ